MTVYIFLLLFISGGKSLKIWIPNTGINNTVNWNEQDLPKNCDNLIFPYKSDIETIWNIKNISISGLSLPGTGDLIFPNKINILLKDKENCSQVRELRFTRTELKGWLDPDNWKTENQSEWLPHAERVPCTGEAISFPSGNTFAIQLPSILLPISEIHFDDFIFDAFQWKNFLDADVGFFKGPPDISSQFWREESDCFGKKKCNCVRSPYTFRDGIYKSVSAKTYEEAVCMYAKPKCEPVNCYSPVFPEGHCCGICGALIKIEDTSEEGLDLKEVEAKIKEELQEYQFDDQLKIYIGRTIDKNIQVVILAENSDAAIESHYFANMISSNFLGEKPLGRILTFQNSGLSLKKYFFNSISGAVFGTLISVILFFGGLFYFYIILPKKKLFIQKPFTFVRFDNTATDESSYDNLEIGVEAQPSQAFDNPMYSAGSGTSEKSVEKDLEMQFKEEKDSKEYDNPIYTKIEESEDSEKFETFNEEKEEGNPNEDMLEFSEIKL